MLRNSATASSPSASIRSRQVSSSWCCAVVAALSRSRWAKSFANGFHVDLAHQFADQLDLSTTATVGLDSPRQLDGVRQLLGDGDSGQAIGGELHQRSAQAAQFLGVPLALALAGTEVLVVLLPKWLSGGVGVPIVPGTKRRVNKWFAVGGSAARPLSAARARGGGRRPGVSDGLAAAIGEALGESQPGMPAHAEALNFSAVDAVQLNDIGHRREKSSRR